MKKTIVEYLRGEEGGKTDVSAIEIPPEKHSAVLQELAELGALMEFVDLDSIRASIDGNWDVVEKLMSHGWSFNPEYE